MIQNPLIFYNTDIPQSLVDAQRYICLRGLPTHLAGINFGTTPGGIVTGATWADGTFTIQPGKFRWNGLVVHAYDNMPFGDWTGAFVAMLNAYPSLDCVLCSTYTPFFFDDGSGLASPLPAQLGDLVFDTPRSAGRWFVDAHSLVQGYLPCGRIGCPASPANAYDFTAEMTPRAGGTLFEQCVGNALAAEQRYNFREPHFSSSRGPVVLAETVPPTAYGFDSTYWSTLMATLRARGCNWTVDLGTDYPAGTGAADDFFAGTLSSPVDLFCLVGPFNLNGDATGPGAHLYSNNYRVRPGGWSCHWWSFQWFWSMDFLYNGGSAAFMTIDEPLSGGIRDPYQMLLGLLSGLSLAECTAILVSDGLSNPNNSYVASAYRQVVVGDPLYRPYATSSLPGAEAGPPGLFPGI